MVQISKVNISKKNKIFCFDIDNTICKTKKNNYLKSKPYKNKILLINKLYKKGYYIKIFTSRYMGRNHEKKKKAIEQGFKKTKFQLKKWGILYHKLIFGKPSYDILIDDKSLFFNKKWQKLLEKKYL